MNQQLHMNIKEKSEWFWEGYCIVLVQQLKFFFLSLLGKVGKKKMFGDILDKNKAFLDYKTAELKKSKNWHFSKGVCVCLSCPTLPKKR